MTTPEPIANIINPAWLATQMGLPVKDVEQKLKKTTDSIVGISDPYRPRRKEE